MKLKLFFIAIATALLVGCDSPTVYNLKSAKPLAAPLNPSGSAYVAMCGDGHFESKPCYGSGQLATTIIASVAREHFKSVYAGDQLRSTNDNLTDASGKKCDYLFQSKITTWADFNSPWNGIPDQVGIELTTIDVQTHEVLNVGQVDVIGPGWTLKDGKPEELLGGGVDRYMKFLLGGKLPKYTEPPDLRMPHDRK